MNQRLRALVIDDEHLARKRLGEMLGDNHLEDIEIVGEANSVSTAAAMCVDLQPDVLFLDIQMTPLNGFALLPYLSDVASNPSVVFVTAHDEYAVRAFEANALDYLLKPIGESRLGATISRLQERRERSAAEALNAPLTGDHQNDRSVRAKYQPQDIVTLKDGGLLVMTKAADILAIKSDGAYCHVSIANRRTLMIKQSISLWEKSLPLCTFLRVSRSLILNKRRIECVKAVSREEFEVHIQGAPDPILVSRLEMSRMRAVLG